MTSMPTRLRVAVVAAIIVLATPATAQKITAEGIARSASLYAAIVEFCPPTQRVNLELATKAAKAMTDAANEALGPDADPTKLNNELKRRFVAIAVGVELGPGEGMGRVGIGRQRVYWRISKTAAVSEAFMNVDWYLMPASYWRAVRARRHCRRNRSPASAGKSWRR